MNRTATFVDSLAALVWHPGTGVLIALLLAAAWIDWRTMRIPNWLTVAGMAWGLAWNATSGPSIVDGLLFGLGGLGLGFAMFLPLWLLRVLGAGDVKLMAMVGAFLGAGGVFVAALLVGMVGGIAVALFAISHRAVRRLAGNVRDIAVSVVVPGMPLWRPGATSIGKLPYGVSIGAGTLAFLLLRQLGYA